MKYVTNFTKSNRHWLALIVIVLFGASLRLWRLGSLPNSLHRDEAAIGYNAYSLALTGYDEHGQPWPVNFESFGDYKLPGLIYSSAPLIKLMGLTPLSVRLPTSIFSILTLITVYWLVREIGWPKSTAVLTTILLSCSYWHISQARNAYEPMAGLFWSTLAWASWLKARHRPFFYGVALIGLTIGVAFYNLPLFLIPLLIAGSILVSYKRYSKQKVWLGLSLFFLALIVSVSWIIFNHTNQSKIGTTVLSNSNIIQLSKQMTHASLVAGFPSRVARLLTHPFLLGLTTALKNYFAAFDLTYLFFKGDHNYWHNLRPLGFGNLNIFLLIPFLAGGFRLAQQTLIFLKTPQKKAGSIKYVLSLYYLLISPIVSAFTIDAPITNRLLDFNLAVILTAAVGLSWIWRCWREISWLNTVMRIYATGYFIFFGFFLFRYFALYNYLLPPVWQPQAARMISEVSVLRNEYDLIIVDLDDFELSYIYFAFYTPFNPSDFQADADWRQAGFHFVSSYDQYRFESVPEWTELDLKQIQTYLNREQSRVLVVTKGEPEDLAAGTESLVFEIQDWQGKVNWTGWEINYEQAYNQIQQLPITTKRQEILNYLETCMQNQCSLPASW